MAKTQPSQDSDHYRTRFHGGVPGEQPRLFDSPTFDDCIQGTLALIDTTLREFPAADNVSVKVYHVGGPYKEHHLVSEISLKNVNKWHPAGEGPKIVELMPEDYLLIHGKEENA